LGRSMSVGTPVSVVLILLLTNGGTLRIVPEDDSASIGGGLHSISNTKIRQAGSGISAATASVPQSSTDTRRWATLAIVCLAQVMIVLDVTIVNVALPAIQQDLGFSQGNLTWVVNAFLVTFGSLLLLSGRIGDLVGRRRVFLAGLVTFTVASLLCGVAPTQEAL